MSFVPAWLVLLVLQVVLILAINPRHEDFLWSRSQRRPNWIAGNQVWIPLYWFGIHVAIFLSALSAWSETGSRPVLIAYGVLVILVQGYPWLMCRTRNLRIGALACLSVWAFAVVLAGFLVPMALPAALLMVPLLLWAPAEAWMNWHMLRLNR